ncbi:MAG: FAD-dependent oxidoreductase, partial [Dactylosporangium sp.]|nr:FAD-dependent oxidoreductase [Dactylosporangium sp.]
VLRRDDADLVALVREELGELLGRPLPEPAAALVTRWGGALPQYAPGHLQRVARARAAVPATVALAGAAYDGVGIPACVRSGETAADKIISALGGSVT